MRRERARASRPARAGTARPPTHDPFPPGPKLTVDAVLMARGRVLLVRRGRPPFEGRWALPGGFVEAGETTEAAVRRELWEETGLRALVQRLVGVYSDPGRDPRGPTVTVAYRMRLPRGRVRSGDDAGGAAWFRLEETPRLAFDHDRILRDALANRTQ